jgi:hypothetical protein
MSQPMLSFPPPIAGSEVTPAPFERNQFVPSRAVRPSIQVMLDPKLFAHVQAVAKMMSRAEGMIPKHLIGREAACFWIVVNSCDWGLNPFQVASATYETRNNKLGFMAVLVHAIMQASGQLDEPITPRYIGDWSPIIGAYRITERVENGRTIRVAEPTWTDEIARASGAGIVLSTVVRKKPIDFEFFLYQAWPRHSVLWATDPKTQLFYAALRRFATAHLSSALMGLVIEGDDDEAIYTPREAVDVTPATPPAAPTTSPRQDVVEIAQKRRAARARSAAPQTPAEPNENAQPLGTADSSRDHVDVEDTEDDETKPPPGSIYIRVPGERAIRALPNVEQAAAFVVAARKRFAANPEWAEAMSKLNAKLFERHPELAAAMTGPLPAAETD